MKRILRWGAIGLGVFALALVGTIVAARFADGPIGPIAGGGFRSGEPYEGSEPDWGMLRGRSEVEFQLLEPERSRTTWILEHNGRIYIPSGYMLSAIGKRWKQWPAEAERDGRAILRVDGVLYPRQLLRIQDGPELVPLAAELGRKYLGTEELTPEAREEALQGALDRIASGDLLLFELRPRP